MKKRKLFILGIFFPLFICSCSEELDYGPQPTDEESAMNNFGIDEARNYFEANAKDLAPLQLSEQPPTKSADLPALELSPEWNRASISGHSAVRLIEIPIQSNSINVCTERVIKAGKSVFRKRYPSHRRLVIARRSTGETDMFVITLIPSPKAFGNVEKSMDNFHYLGGGDFTGRVFCSTLEGEFVKAFGYTDGKLNGQLFVMKRTELEKHAGESLAENYSAISLEDGIRTATGYAFNEDGYGGGGTGGGIGGGTGTGGGVIGGGELGEVVIVACPDCHSQDGCRCPRCFYCGNKEKNCVCKICFRCHNKVAQCICYLYPDPGTGGGGGGSGGGTTPGGSGGGTLPAVNLTNEDNFVGYDVSGDCMAGCRSIMNNYGVSTGSTTNVYQLMYERNKVLEYYDIQNYSTVYDNAINCIDRHLDADRPIIIGVNHTEGKTINEGATDHWIVLTGREYDTNQSMYYYIYMDTGRNNAADGCNTTNNRLYYDSTNHTFRDESAGVRDLKTYDVTQVRPNDGQHLNETINQPSKPIN